MKAKILLSRWPKIFCIAIFVFVFFLKTESSALAKGELHMSKSIEAYKSFSVTISNLSTNACYVLKIKNNDTQQYLRKPNSNLSGCGISAIDGNLDNYYTTKTKNNTGTPVLIEGLTPNSYEITLYQAHCQVLNISCWTVYEDSVLFNVAPSQPPPQDSPPLQGSCIIGFQTPNLGSDCISCIITNSQPPNLIEKIRSSNPTFLSNCTNQEVVNYWCNGGLTDQEKQACEGIQNSSCPSLCGKSSPPKAPSKSSIPTPPPPPPPCKTWEGEKCVVVDTALGDFNTDPAKFAGKLMGIILGLSGGIAVLLIIISGYRFMASQGNPEKVQAAREGLTSAIVGLLFIIFSIVILQIIGVDILQLPGFK